MTEEEQGRKDWNRSVAKAGFRGDTDALWDAMIAARETSGFALPPEDIAADQTRLCVFCDSVRGHLDGTAPDEAIKTGLLAMPRTCAWCEAECWVWCQTCGGCAMCCSEDYHCVEHGCSFGICQCPESNFRDSHGNPPE
jgi:hypothetical protein